MALSTRNIFKEVHVTKSRGALGTGFTYAPVLLFERYLAMAIVRYTVNQVSARRTRRVSIHSHTLLKFACISMVVVFLRILNFYENIIFRNFPEIWDLIKLALALHFLYFITSILIFNKRSTRFSLGFLADHRVKHCQLDQICSLVHHFSRTPVWPA